MNRATIILDCRPVAESEGVIRQSASLANVELVAIADTLDAKVVAILRGATADMALVVFAYSRAGFKPDTIDFA